jgi:hypothetical protein
MCKLTCSIDEERFQPFSLTLLPSKSKKLEEIEYSHITSIISQRINFHPVFSTLHLIGLEPRFLMSTWAFCSNAQVLRNKFLKKIKN